MVYLGWVRVWCYFQYIKINILFNHPWHNFVFHPKINKTKKEEHYVCWFFLFCSASFLIGGKKAVCFRQMVKKHQKVPALTTGQHKNNTKVTTKKKGVKNKNECKRWKNGFNLYINDTFFCLSNYVIVKQYAIFNIYVYKFKHKNGNNKNRNKNVRFDPFCNCPVDVWIVYIVESTLKQITTNKFPIQCLSELFLHLLTKQLNSMKKNMKRIQLKLTSLK